MMRDGYSFLLLSKLNCLVERFNLMYASGTAYPPWQTAVNKFFGLFACHPECTPYLHLYLAKLVLGQLV